ncbi:MAG: pyrrolysine--tRNA(Pyl) ligase large subunit [Methanomassiliicoccaceae archaeon]|nr:pyrrolysine--tRNA(Pyl) ligase large subunit [Methanomassiliicoccaceae archaeon]
MVVRYTESQIQKLREYGDGPVDLSEFSDAAERDISFTKLMAAEMSANDAAIKDMVSNPRGHDLVQLERELSKALMDAGFVEVRTPTIISKAALAKMTITEDHPLYRQVFFIDSKRCLRPMLAPNLYYYMRKLRDHTDDTIRFFEIGSCFRKESHSGRHLEEFTMLNLVEQGQIEDPVADLREFIDIVMDTVGMKYETAREESDVYVETLDVEVDGVEVASGAVGPHILDAAHDIHEPWCGIGFGLERLLAMKNGKNSVRKTGRSLTYMNGRKID